MPNQAEEAPVPFLWSWHLPWGSRRLPKPYGWVILKGLTDPDSLMGGGTKNIFNAVPPFRCSCGAGSDGVLPGICDRVSSSCSLTRPSSPILHESAISGSWGPSLIAQQSSGVWMGGTAQTTNSKEIEREKQEQLATATSCTHKIWCCPSLTTMIKRFWKGVFSKTILLALDCVGHFVDPTLSYLLTLYL